MRAGRGPRAILRRCARSDLRAAFEIKDAGAFKFDARSDFKLD
jgi:hypothetical protein